MRLDEVRSPFTPTGHRRPRVIMELAREGMTMLIVTDEMGFARDIVDRVAF